MTGSLTVVRIENVKDIFKKKTGFSVKKDFSLENYEFQLNKLGEPLTEIFYCDSTPEYHIYLSKLSTNTIERPIYIYKDGIEEYTLGYQEIKEFKFLIDTDFTTLYIFAPKRIARPFQARLDKEDYLRCSKIIFDFSRLQELSNFITGYGTWEDSDGVITKTGKFGHGIETTIENFSMITAFYIDYSYKNKRVQLILNVEGRISTTNELTEDDLLYLYNEIKDTLVKK
ncbi:hypothetical protein [Methanosarcina sp.]|uniref:hypothetical protein n=1 Tax=Methanosarcina sp. TaxID=2213 RepID=UPI003C724F8F